MPGRTTATLGWTLAAAATYAAVFVLPYRFPLREPVLSDAWTAGANNQVAAIGVALVSLAVTLVCWYRTRPEQTPEATSQLSARFLYAAILIATLWTASLGWAVARAHMYWRDEGYFLNQLRTGLVFHRALYTQFEFAYGPLLFLWPALCIKALAPLGISFTAAYLVSLAILQALGLALLFYVVQALPLRRSLKACAFVLTAFGALNSLLGLNYTLFRFILPAAAVVLLSRQRSLASAALVAGCAEIACLATSPELGIAFAAATIAYALYRATRDGLRWLQPAAATLVAAACYAAIAGQAAFFTLGNMARGGFTLLLTPAPHILALLVAAVALAPLAVARTLRNSSNGPLILALYVASLGLIPAALGRCDPIHAFCDGIGMYLLSFLALNAASPRWRRIWISAVVLVFVIAQAKNARLYQFQLSLARGAASVQEDWGFDEAALRQAIGTAQISAPILAPQHILDDLTRTNQYVPGFFCGWVGVWDRQSEQRKIEDMRRTPFALVALTDPAAPDPARDRQIALAMRLGFAGHPPNPGYVRGALLDAELQSHWTPRARLGDYVLYRRKD